MLASNIFGATKEYPLIGKFCCPIFVAYNPYLIILNGIIRYLIRLEERGSML